MAAVKDKNITNIIKDILTNNVSARNNDKALYILVMEKLSPGISKRQFDYMFLNLEDLGLPCYDTVTRLRRKVQNIYPELKACDKVQDYRTAREEQYRREFGCG